MTLDEFNKLSAWDASEVLSRCCGAPNWISQMMMNRPYSTLDDLLLAADETWIKTSFRQVMSALAGHPKIGDKENLKTKFADTATWAGEEQTGIDQADDNMIERLAQGNNKYEQKFGYIFIVSATGKSATEILELLEFRLTNRPDQEYDIVMAEQGKITKIRLQKLLS